MALLCFDVDGTLDIGDGPIPAALLHDLENMGHDVVIVSPSPLRPKDAGFPEFLSVDRKKNLLDALEAHPVAAPSTSATTTATTNSPRKSNSNTSTPSSGTPSTPG